MSHRETTATTCHCGADFNRSDHCDYCGCEQFEAYCDVAAEADLLSPADFIAANTHQVVSFEPNGERFQNTVTGRLMDAGALSFDCGHSYTWHPYGLRDADPMPAAGAQMLCAVCIEAALAAFRP